MIHEKNDNDLRDMSRVDVSQEIEKDHWLQKWNITEDILEEAINKSDSVMATDVERYLRKNNYIS